MSIMHRPTWAQFIQACLFFFIFFHAVDLERIASIALSSLSDVEVLQSSQAEAEGKAEDREDRSHNGGHGYYVHHKQSY